MSTIAGFVTERRAWAANPFDEPSLQHATNHRSGLLVPPSLFLRSILAKIEVELKFVGPEPKEISSTAEKRQEIVVRHGNKPYTYLYIHVKRLIY